jgi:hemerythrin-like domain-containing protein
MSASRATGPGTGTDTRDMLVVHDSIRRQFGQATLLVRGVAPGDTDRAAVVADHVDLLGALLHHDHVGEDRLLWPVLQPRVPAEVAETVARMESQHEGIAEVQGTVTTALAAWRSGAGEEEREALATAWEALLDRVTEHLAAEEKHILPLAAAHMTPAEWQRLGEEGIGGLPRSSCPWCSGW